MPKSHKMMLHTKRDMILINKNMLEVTGDTNPVQAGLYCKKEKKFVRYPHHLYNLHLYSTLLQRHLCPHHLECYQHIELSAGNAVRNAIWCSSLCCRDSATHAKAWSRSLAASTGRLLWPISAVLTPDLILLAVLCCCCHTYGLIRVVCVFFLVFFDNASVPILGGLPGSVQHECFLSWGQNGNDKAIAILSALPW